MAVDPFTRAKMRFLDRGMFNLRPDYLAIAQDYERVLKQRGALLKTAGAAGGSGSAVRQRLV